MAESNDAILNTVNNRLIYVVLFVFYVLCFVYFYTNNYTMIYSTLLFLALHVFLLILYLKEIGNNMAKIRNNKSKQTDTVFFRYENYIKYDILQRFSIIYMIFKNIPLLPVVFFLSWTFVFIAICFQIRENDSNHYYNLYSIPNPKKQNLLKSKDDLLKLNIVCSVFLWCIFVLSFYFAFPFTDFTTIVVNNTRILNDTSRYMITFLLIAFMTITTMLSFSNMMISIQSYK